jgi:hypothetical protein
VFTEDLTTDNSGKFSYQLNVDSSLVGHMTMGARHPTSTDFVEQASVDVVDITLNKLSITATISEGIVIFINTNYLRSNRFGVSSNQ